MPHVYNHNDGITNMAKKFTEMINTANPQFLQEYEGWKIADSPNGKFYTVENGQFKEIDPEAMNKQWLKDNNLQKGEYGSGRFWQDFNAKLVSFDKTSGLQPAGKGSYQNTEAWRYSGETPTAENNWLGQGRPAPAADQYTGQTGGYTSGGVLLYKLKDGTVTSTPPPGQTAPAPISQEEMKVLGPEVTTGGVVTPESQAEANQPTFNPATPGASAGVANNSMGNIPNGSIVKFDSGPEVYLVDNGTLRHFTKEVKDKSGRSIFVSMETIPASYKANFTMGTDISSDIPFNPETKGWAGKLTTVPPTPRPLIVPNISGQTPPPFVPPTPRPLIVPNISGMKSYSNMPVIINFKAGLMPEQKESIWNLYFNKPQEQWNEEDLKNWQFAQANVEKGDKIDKETRSELEQKTKIPITPATPTSPALASPVQTQKATLYGPNGQKEVVDVGSARASELQSQGWKLTEATPAVPPASAATVSADKTIYKRGKDLYTKIGNTYYRIPDQKTLYDLVVNQKYNDARTELPADAQLDTWGDIPVEKPVEKPTIPPVSTFDPFEEVMKYGYSREDFANDPNFFDYWSKKTPELLKTALAMRSDWDITANKKRGATPESTYDPYDEAAKYGYSREDFANDKEFFNYWSKKTPEQLATALALRTDWDVTAKKKKVTTAEPTYDPFEEAAKYGYTRDELIQNDPNFESYWSKKTPEQLLAGLSARSDWDATTKKKKIVPPAETLQTIYGQTKQPVEVETLVGNFIGAAATSFLRNGGISQTTFDKYVKNDPTQLAKYVNAMLYGGYDKVDFLYRDLKAKELADQGNAAYQNYKTFDELVPASQWYVTPEGQKVLNDVTLASPAGVINETLLNNTIFTIPNEAFSTLFEPIDINSPAFKAEAEKIQASYYDIMTQKAQAETEQQKAVADENYKMFTADLNKKYKIQLSDNAQTAWGQLQNLFSGATQRGIGQSGLIGEAMDKYLADQRNRNQIMRDEKTTTQEKETLNNLLKSGSSAEIQTFVAANPDRAKQLGLVPSTEVANWYSAANLKTLYPDMTDTEINNIRNSMIDENGNYRSDLYQTLEANRYGFGQDKQTYQQQKLYEQKLTEEEKAYRPYTRGNLLSSYTGVKPTPAAPATPPAASATKKKVQVKDKNGNLITVYEDSIPALIAEGTLPVGTTAAAATEPKVSVKDKKGNTILVYPSSIPGLIAEGTLPAGTTPTSVSSAVPTTPTPASAAPAIKSTSKKVQVKDKNGNLINVYEDSIPDLIKEGTLPAGTTAATFSSKIPGGLTSLQGLGGITLPKQPGQPITTYPIRDPIQIPPGGIKSVIPKPTIYPIQNPTLIPPGGIFPVNPSPNWGGIGSKPFLPETIETPNELVAKLAERKKRTLETPNELVAKLAERKKRTLY